MAIVGLLFVLTLILNNVSAQEVGTDNEIIEQTNDDIAAGEKEISDHVIQKRLQNIYKNINALSDITVLVKGGVVTLSGIVNSNEAYELAVNLADRVEGVVGINNQVVLDNSVTQRLNAINNKINTIINRTFANLPVYLIAITVFVFFWFLSFLVSRQKFIFNKIAKNAFLQSLVSQVVRGVIIIIGFVLTLEILDATALLGTILGAAGIFGLAIGFAIRDTVENYIASILLSVRQPFSPNDHIVLEGYEGKVVKLTSRDTILMTLDGNHVRIPNAKVYKGNILNYTRNSLRRLTFEVGVDSDVELTAAQELAVNTLQIIPGVLNDPAAECRIEKLGDSNVILVLMAWVDQNEVDFSKVKSEAIRLVKEQFEEANFEMPEPIYRIKIQDNSSVPEELRKSGSQHEKSVPTTQSLAEIDVSKDTHIEEQIRRDKLTDKEPDLLSP